MEGGLAELHTHLGPAVASVILWSLAHEQGIALPVKYYWEFDQLVTVSEPHGVDGLGALRGTHPRPRRRRLSRERCPSRSAPLGR